jgi:hypothetical protein
MAEESNMGRAFACDGPKYLCPHCQFLNPRPEKRYLEGVSGVLCKRCLQAIPVETFDKAPDQE